MTANETAFLTLIAIAEGTQGQPDPYAVCFGYQFSITDFSDHPCVLGTWAGEPLAFLGPAYAHLHSTAAGRYQITMPTWLMCQKALKLPDFSPASQDAAAILLIKLHFAYTDVMAGNIASAIAKCRSEWASFPGNSASQPQKTLTALLAAYRTAGGVCV